MATTDNVLLVDDEVEFVETLAERLRTRGLNVEVATSGEEGVEKAKKTTFQAVVLDLAMPGMDGHETLRALREVDPDLPVLLSSGYNEPGTEPRSPGEAPTGFLRKPYSISVLHEAVRSALHRPAEGD